MSKLLHQTSLLHIESSPDRLGLLAPTRGQRSQQESGLNHAAISFDQQAQVSQGHTSCRNKESCSTDVHRGVGLQPVKLTRDPAPSHLKPCASLKNAPRILPECRSVLTLEGRKQTVAGHQFSLRKPPGLRLLFSRARVQHFLGSSTAELSSALAESGAYLPDRTYHGTLVRAAAPCQAFRDSAAPPLGRHLLPKCTKLALGKRRAPCGHHPQLTTPPPRLNGPAESFRQPVGCIF